MDINELRQRCKRKSDYLITMFFTNRLALWLTYLILRTKITPNHITLVSLACCILCSLFYSQGLFIWGSLFLFLAHLFDCIDGNLARAKQLCSSYGKLLDMSCDRLGESLIFIGVSWYFWDFSQKLSVLALLDGLLLMLYYYIVDILLSLNIYSMETHNGWIYDGVRLKWGLMEPVIYGFIFFSLIGLIEIQIYLIFILVIIGLIFQFYRMTTMIIRSS